MLLCVAAGCKTTEANYKAAYEAAAAQRQSQADAADDFLNRPDSTVVRTMFLSPVKLADDDVVTPASTPKYCVVVNRFKQVFNARALCRRLRGEGYADAFVVGNTDDEYFVAAFGAGTQEEARALAGRLRSDSSVPFGRGYPAVIRAAWK